MIIDELSQLRNYLRIHPALKDVADYLESHDLAACADGRYPLDGDGRDDCFVNVQTIPAKGEGEARLESHRAMIDIQVPLTGDETMGYVSLERAEEAPYDGNKDIAFHQGSADTYLRVRKGMFAIFFPQDVHAPGITPSGLKKAVFKIPVLSEDTSV